MENFTDRHTELFTDVVDALEKINSISFKYKDMGIYELPRVSSVDKHNTYSEYAITEFKKDVLVTISLDDTSVKRLFSLYDLNLAESIDLYEYIHEYITQSN
jgi:hypothetical protein